ncbi:hypothetical protein ACFLZ8_02180 [Planctomycetota bacterium]
MNKRNDFTRLDLVFVIFFMFIAMALFVSCMNNLRYVDQRRQICLSNLKNLGMAWMMYADDNNQRICASTFDNEHNIEHNGAPPWCGSAYSGRIWVLRPEEEQIEAIKEGALWPYINNTSLYRCPAGMEGQW